MDVMKEPICSYMAVELRKNSNANSWLQMIDHDTIVGDLVLPMPGCVCPKSKTWVLFQLQESEM